jgi:hypothetical protein
VATVELTMNQRPSALLAACAPAAAGELVARSYGAGQTAVPAQLLVRMWGTSGTAHTVKINNSMGSAFAQGEGMAKSIFQDQSVSAVRVHKVQDDRIQGGSARGIPPRGRPD